MNRVLNKPLYIIRSINNLVFPKSCVNCKNILKSNQNVLCLSCQTNVKSNNNFDIQNNTLTSKFKGRINIYSGYYLLQYEQESIAQKLIHSLKYKGREDIGTYLGNWISDIIFENHLFSNVDYIIPVPIHTHKKKTRGYNQLNKLCRAVASKNNINYLPNIVTRKENNTPQAQKKLNKRIEFDNIETFRLNTPRLIMNKNILLVDDVITTGTTLESFAKTFAQTNCQINILSISLSK